MLKRNIRKDNSEKDNSDNGSVDGLRLAGEADSSKTGESGTKTSKEKEFEEPTLYSFIYSPQEVERAIRHSRFCECRQYTINLLSKRSMGTGELWYALDPYDDVREAVLAQLKLEKVIKIRWYANPVGEKGKYYLNKNRKKISP